mmetsp:Transcript_10833/g.15864  ORF Transcript_10833/g.15864 Transcript_10833/m.15864 type:complete len:258 (-) Transcript_10833:52-825(-)|eukprot:CAMPEP_0117420634 /NCGR_PEP_ID=MMETSP0758-20121206/1924_1 /TAXON_ID=63605 /ORGANISM="Percolomonas cosmopolitus, Strain AE-1 (ATCC 50343)" /LENGTH=257 /DNA_ID=CAMNT_0005202351 /DNA_START=24 /DNA_END=797 /DNA_ORIENTATION=-
MSRRYDGRTTTFSRSGRLYQVEYAIQAIMHAGTAIGILCDEGVVLVAEKKIVSKLLDKVSSEKMFKIDDHINCVVAGITADANSLLQYTRVAAQRYRFTYNEDIPVEYLVQQVCNVKQSYTQYGGQRPFGVSFLYAGYDDKYGYQLYNSDPSGNYGGWKATAIGESVTTAQAILKNEWKEGMSLHDALLLGVKVITKTTDSTAVTPEKLEFSTLSRDKDTNELSYQQLTEPEIEVLINQYKKKVEEEEKEKESSMQD